MKLSMGAACIVLAAQTGIVYAEEKDTIDEIIVAGHAIRVDQSEVRVEDQMLVDTAIALKDLPGANVNSNGSITGIAQYRGMYGDRVAVSIDEHSIVSGGPNAMDAPLSYVSPMITESIIVERGISSVSSGAETIGGHIKSQLARGEFGDQDFRLSGMVGTRYSSNGDLSTTAARLTLSDQNHRVSAIAEYDHGNNTSTPAGRIHPSAVDRKRYDVSYAYNIGDSHLALFAGKLNTTDSGTPALPMDIRSIDTDIAGGHFLHSVSEDIAIEGGFSFNDVDHIMDNFSLRGAPTQMMYRQNYATGRGQTYKLSTTLLFDGSSLQGGLTGSRGDHDSVITNPNNMLFSITNFADVRRELNSLFAEWQVERESSSLELGIAAKRVQTRAGNIGFAGMMSPAAEMLAGAFNGRNRDLRFDDVDAVAKFVYRTRSDLLWTLELAQKTRAPSYQELYLWLPMQATGGLADGRTYVGDLDLESERSSELNIGFAGSFGYLNLTPQVYYKRVDRYVQGAPAQSLMANMMSMMMTGSPALQFTNTDAEIYGADLGWSYALNENLTIDGIATYTRGNRVDVADSLYRIAPLNGALGVRYANDTFSAHARLVAYAKQSRVSNYNDETPSDAYERLDIGASWSPSQSLRFDLSVNNLFDATYQEHLGGVNRARDADIAVGDRLYSADRTLIAGIMLSW
ncbi:MAG: TonB-dependent receptor [Gammaproteobacteria bacterium]|nr:TonB-dependent receptor [Gammaproteobacteria bacterium]